MCCILVFLVIPLQDEEPTTYRWGGVVSVRAGRGLGRVSLDPQLALSLTPTTIRPGLNASTLIAALHVQDNKYVLKVSSSGRSLFYKCFIVD